MLPSVERKWRFPTPGHQRVLKLRGDAQQIFVNGEFSGGSSGFWDYTIYVNPYMVVRPEGHYTKHIYVNSQRIASKIGNPEDYAGCDPTTQGSPASKKVLLEEVVEENFTELFRSIPDIEAAADTTLGRGHGGSGGEPHQYWFTADHLGSSAFVTDASGAAIQHLEYMAFGEVFVDERRTGFGTPYKFNAKELDCESGYYYYGARYYDPRMVRFLSVDPLAGEMPAWGSYTYTFDNPIRLVDPTGMRPEDPPDAGDDDNKILYMFRALKEVPNGLMYALGIGSPEPGLQDGKIPGTGKTILSNNLGEGTHAVPEAEQGSDAIVDLTEIPLPLVGVIGARENLPRLVNVEDNIFDAMVNLKQVKQRVSPNANKKGKKYINYNHFDTSDYIMTVDSSDESNWIYRGKPKD